MDSSTTVVSSAVAALVAGSAVAGITPGTMVRAIPSSGEGTAITRMDPAAGPGTYASDLDGTPFAGRGAAQLVWGASTVSFTGLASGGADATLRTQGIAIVDVASASQFSINWNLSQAMGVGVEASWGLIDLAGGSDPTYGVAFDDGAGTAYGGVGTTASGSFVGAIAAGTYMLVMLADASTVAGPIGFSASFTAVPAPGVFALLALAGVLGTRRRLR